MKKRTPGRFKRFDRFAVRFKPLASRRNRKAIESDHVSPDAKPARLSAKAGKIVSETAARIRAAQKNGRPVMLAFGGHTIKNGLAPLLIRLIEEGWITLLATNGAGIIHDWEYSFLGLTSEDVKDNVASGEFGNWQETGMYINLAIVVGAYEGRGYGESVGAFIENDGLTIPDPAKLEKDIAGALRKDPAQAAAAADLLATIRLHGLNAGRLNVPHRWKRFSAQAAAFRLKVPFTAHPMFGHDIIYNHPMNCGAAIGRAAERDFLTYAGQVQELEGGVYMSVGSAVMSPMIFEKSLSLAQNVAIQEGRHIDNHFIMVADLAESRWDWSRGEPPETSPDYYLRFNKSFSRMGGTMRYATADNRDLLLALWHNLDA